MQQFSDNFSENDRKKLAFETSADRE